MSEVIYLDTSAVLRAILERALSPDIERRIGDARFLITSRLSLVESARAMLRLRAAGTPERTVTDAMRETDTVWSRCTLWELTPAVCDLTGQVAPLANLSTLDALHAATYVIARRRLAADVDLLTADSRLDEAIRALDVTTLLMV